MSRISRAEDLFWPTPRHPVETIANLDAVRIEECGEPMVELAQASPSVTLHSRAGFDPETRGRLYVRESVATRLTEAQANLALRRPELQLAILDGWRPSARQKRAHYAARFFFRLRYPYLSAALIREAANKYVAAPDALAPPPHSTGGAIDLRLVSRANGRNLPMGGPARTDHERVMGAAHENRALLADVMNAAGFSNYEEEWWHWSYGDSGWALRTNREKAIYGRTSPPGRAGSARKA